MAKQGTEFEQEVQKERPSLVREFISFMANNKKWWLLPIIICLALLAVLAILAGTGAGPFVYTLF
jgi:hypothetical protein